MSVLKRLPWCCAAAFAFAMPAAMFAGPILTFAQTNLVSDIPGMAARTDPNLKNPWGIATSATSPFWISDNGTGVSTLYNTAGVPQALVVTIPKLGGGVSAPTGQVFNGTSSVFNGDLFIFATEDGTIAGWRGALGTTAEILSNSAAGGAVFKGLAIGTTANGTYLYAADFANGKIAVLPGGAAPALSGTFTDPTLPSGFAPFNIQNLNGQLYVTYAKKAPGSNDDQAGPGNGYVSVFDLNGNFQKRLISNGPLNSPWGLAIAPATFGTLGGDLLVGNFGDGTINAFDPTGAFLGTLSDATGNPLVNDGLWGLKFGNGGNGGRTWSLYITAGLNGEENGLFAQVDAVPEPGTWGLLAGGALVLTMLKRRR